MRRAITDAFLRETDAPACKTGVSSIVVSVRAANLGRVMMARSSQPGVLEYHRGTERRTWSSTQRPDKHRVAELTLTPNGDGTFDITGPYIEGSRDNRTLTMRWGTRTAAGHFLLFSDTTQRRGRAGVDSHVGHDRLPGQAALRGGRRRRPRVAGDLTPTSASTHRYS